MEQVVYSLQGESLEIAKRIGEAHQISVEEFGELEDQVDEFRANLIQQFEEKFDEKFRTLFQEMAKAICVPVEQLQKYNLDLTYLNTHSLAFLKEGPIQDTVVVLNVNPVLVSDLLD